MPTGTQPKHHVRNRRRSGNVIRFPGIAALVVSVAILAYLALRPPEVAVPAAQAVRPASAPQKRGEVVFTRPDGAVRARVHVEIADEPHSRQLGLMYRRSMGMDYGMLFIFDSAATQTFWMKNTILPLDMIFVDSGGRVVTIHRNTEPHSLQTYASSGPALYVVEVNAGFARLHGVATGDRMEWSRMGEKEIRP